MHTASHDCGSLAVQMCLCVFRKSPGESGVEVVPTPAARPSLRDMHSPQPHAKSTMEEDVKRHSTPDSPPPPRRHKEKVLVHTFVDPVRRIKPLPSTLWIYFWFVTMRN